MRTTLVLRKLEKAIAIVELIQKANNNAEQARSDLHHWDHSPHQYTSIRLFNTREELSDRRIHWLNVAQRLEGYYERTIEGIFQPVQ